MAAARGRARVVSCRASRLALWGAVAAAAAAAVRESAGRALCVQAGGTRALRCAPGVGGRSLRGCVSFKPKSFFCSMYLPISIPSMLMQWLWPAACRLFRCWGWTRARRTATSKRRIATLRKNTTRTRCALCMQRAARARCMHAGVRAGAHPPTCRCLPRTAGAQSQRRPYTHVLCTRDQGRPPRGRRCLLQTPTRAGTQMRAHMHVPT